MDKFVYEQPGSQLMDCCLLLKAEGKNEVGEWLPVSATSKMTTYRVIHSSNKHESNLIMLFSH